ncbi:uncharacterized protein LOC124192706 [Daphnia pulex]|uniref:uncharacterized protein LOC124192706 n=1 Tax=Daphnia pulex TaxID=6669 RepID=UPI001EDD8593|nr:uncharacterized protein LOC124192706 [Daphnia pulex]
MTTYTAYPTTPRLLTATPRLPLISPPRRSNAIPKRQSTTLPRSTQPQLRRISITEAALLCYVEQNYYTDAPVYYTTTYATPTYNTAAPKYYTEEAAYYTTTYAASFTTSTKLSIALLETTTKLRFIFIAISTTMSPLLRPIHRSS